MGSFFLWGGWRADVRIRAGGVAAPGVGWLCQCSLASPLGCAASTVRHAPTQDLTLLLLREPTSRLSQSLSTLLGWETWHSAEWHESRARLTPTGQSRTDAAARQRQYSDSGGKGGRPIVLTEPCIAGPPTLASCAITSRPSRPVLGTSAGSRASASSAAAVGATARCSTPSRCFTAACAACWSNSGRLAAALLSDIFWNGIEGEISGRGVLGSRRIELRVVKICIRDYTRDTTIVVFVFGRPC